MQSRHQRNTIAALGYGLGPDCLKQVIALYSEQQQRLAEAYPATAVDIAYGTHPRQVLDLYQPLENEPGKQRPVLVFVHGGGFLKGDKGDNGSWHNANVGRMAAKAGFVGVVINYRLAPEHTWPAGSDDLALAIEWVQKNIQAYGGDASKLVLMGTSAGAVHVSGYLNLYPAQSTIKGAVLLSGLYGFTPLDERDCFYYGEQALYAERAPQAAVTNTDIPLMVTCSEYDPPRFQQEFVGLMQARLQAKGIMPRASIIPGHNHYSLATHLGTDDTRLSDEISAFIQEVCA